MDVTEKGHEKIGFFKSATENPWSYIVNVNGKEYRRNRQHLLPVGENRPPASSPIEPASAAAAPQPSYADKVKSSIQMPRDRPVTSSQPIKPGEDRGTPATSHENNRCTRQDLVVSLNHHQDMPETIMHSYTLSSCSCLSHVIL